LSLLLPLRLLHQHVKSVHCAITDSASLPSYCYDEYFPTFYTFIQATYWNQGLFNYWTLQQLPNFILALPTLLLSMIAVVLLWTQRRQHAVTSRRATQRRQHAVTSRRARVSAILLHSLFETEWAPHCFLLTLQCVMAVCASHVQTVTRFVASSPALYAGAALLCAKGRVQRAVVVGFFLLYSIVGTILFNAFYPWT